MRTIFITRDLKQDSPLRRWAAATGNLVTGRSLLDFAAVPFAPPGEAPADWWFFYSSRAVEFGLVEKLPESVKLAAIGPGTAKALLGVAGRVDFTGEGSPEEVAAAFGEIAAGATVFFPRALQSRRTVQHLLADKITVLDAICYDNVMVPAAEPVAADVYVFTSPLNVEAYLDHQPLAPAARVIAIGPSTAAALEARGVGCEMAEQPGEEWVVAML